MTITRRQRQMRLWGTVAGVVLLLAIAAANDTETSADPALSDTTRLESRFDILMAWGIQALDGGRFNEAEARFREILDADWNNPRAFSLLQQTRNQRDQTVAQWRQLAGAAERDGLWERARLYYQKIRDELPHDAAATRGIERADIRMAAARHVQLGLERFVMGDYAEAQAEFTRALKITPGDSMAALYLQRAEQETMQSSSLADLRADERVWSQYLDALKRFRAGDLPGAETLWRQVLEKYPGNQAVLSNLEQITRRRQKEFSAESVNP